MDKDKKLEFLRGLEKLKASKIKSDDYSSPLSDDVMKVKGDSVADEVATKIKGMTQKIDTKGIAPVISGDEFAAKIAALRAAKGAGKKALAALPFVGAGMAALSGDPAMAAEELAQDAMGPAGIAMEALKSEDAGNVEEEKQMLAERRAKTKYKNSPAAVDARFQRIRNMLGMKKPE
jgi:hypothetical protein